MNKAAKLLAMAHARGIRTTADGSDLRLRGPKRALTGKMTRLLAKYKAQILSILVDAHLERVDTKPRESSRNHEVSYPRSAKSLLVESFQGLVGHALVVPFGNEEIPFGIWDGQVLAGATIGIDTETSRIEGHSIPRLILASASDTRQHVVIPRERLLDFIRIHNERTFVAHNATFDHWVLVEALGADADLWWHIVDEGRLRCTDLLEQLILLAKFDEYPRSRSLAELASRYLDVDLFGKDDPRRLQFDRLENTPLYEVEPWYLQYAVQDAVAAVRIYRKQRARAKQLQPDPAKLLPDAVAKFGLLSEIIQVRGAIALAQITRNGMHLAPDRLGPAQQALRERVFQLAEELEAAAPEPVLKRYKLDRYKNDANRGYRLNASGTPQVNEDVIRRLFQEVADQHHLEPPTSDENEKLSLTKHFWAEHRELAPVVETFLELKAQGKLLGFFNNLKGESVHPTYNPIVRSGRVSCRDPNIQQLPRSGGAREIFVPRPEHVLFIIDFAALELRTLAAVCLKRYGESRLAEVVQQGIDAHTYAYCEINGITLDEFAAWKKDDPAAAKAARNKIKPISFGVPGSMQAAGLAQYAKRSYGQILTVEEADELRQHLIHTVFPEWEQFLAQTGIKVYTLTGRVRGRLERSGQLFNTQFQGLAGDGAKLCMYALLRAGYRLTAFVHDEFHIELPVGCDYDAAAKDIDGICCRTMEELTMGVPIETEYAVADRWSKAATAVRDDDGKLQVWSPQE